MDNYQDWLTFAKDVTLGAGRIVSSLYHSDNHATFKPGLDGRLATLTEVDVLSEKHLSTVIRQKFPSHGIYGEEGTNVGLQNDFVWYLDPIDGTTNFWRHIPLFGISVGLTYRKKPVLGVLYFPELKLMVSAYEGGETFANDKKVHVSNRSLEESLYYISCQESRDGLVFPSIGQKVGWVKSIDASSFEFAQIAMGDVELYTFSKPSPHDIVAGVVIVQEAGGMVTDEKNQPWTTNAEKIIASNGVIHQEVLALLDQDLELALRK